jgi:CheY-like chemotaxis protein
VAIDYLRTASAPDLILIDNSLPDMDGIELARVIREQHPGLHERLAFFTAAVRDQDVERFLEAGARGIIRKPFDPLTLGSDVRRLLEPTTSK